MNYDIAITRYCALPHPRSPLPHVTPPIHICPGHHHQLHELLDDLTRLWADMTTLADSKTGAGARSGRTTTAAPTRLDILAINDPHTLAGGDVPPAHAILVGWATALAAERHLTEPTTVPAAIDTLTRHTDWLTEHEAIADIAHELRVVRAALRSITGEQQHVIASCPADDGQGGTCGGPMYQDREGVMQVSCVWCGDVWDSESLRGLARLLTNDERQALGHP